MFTEENWEKKFFKLNDLNPTNSNFFFLNTDINMFIEENCK